MKKKLLIVMIMFCMFFMFFIKNVNAKVYELEEVANYYKTFLKKNYTTSDVKYEIQGIKLSFFDSEDNKFITFTKNDDVLEFVSDALDPTSKDFMNKNINNYFVIETLIQSMISMTGYENYNIDDITEEEIYKNYDKYGLYMKSTTYKNEGENYSYSYEVVEEFKMSLDSEKWDNLFTDYGIKTEDFTPSIEKIIVDKNKVTIKINSNYNGTDTKNLKYYIYRAEEENGEYTKINETAYDYNTIKEVTDTIEEGKTYYYKVSFINSLNESEIKNVNVINNDNDIKNETKEEETTKDGRTNPKTGENFSLTLILLLLISGILLKKKSNKRYF